MPLDFTLDKINGRRSLNLLGMTTYCDLWRLHWLSKFIGCIHEDGHNYAILSTKRVINVPASSYYAGERKRNQKCWIANIAGGLILKTAFGLEVFLEERL